MFAVLGRSSDAFIWDLIYIYIYNDFPDIYGLSLFINLKHILFSLFLYIFSLGGDHL